jgi:hypothetical protein
MSNEKQFSQGFTPNLPLWSFQFQKDSKLALKTRKDLEIHLITRALKDESFRAGLIANPKAVIEQEIGSKLPDELEIRVLEETADTIYMVLPCNPYEGVSEDELQTSLGMTYEDVALWVFEQQKNCLLDLASSIEIITRSWKFQEFKQELFSNPKVLIEKQFDIKILDGFEIKTFEETPHILYLTLPKSLDEFIDKLDISNSELEASAFGGMAIIGASGPQISVQIACPTQGTCKGQTTCRPFPLCF